MRWSQPRKLRREQVLAVVRELANRFLDIRECLVLALLHEPAENFGSPAPRQLLERAHVEVAIVEELLECRHVSREEASVLADAVAAHRRGIRLDEHIEYLERALLGARGGVLALTHALDEARGAV